MRVKPDSYRESQVRTMLAHEMDPNNEHYAARLSHWWGDAKDINIEADALALLADAFAGKYIEVNPPKDDRPRVRYRFWNYELYEGKKPLFFVHLDGLSNLDVVKLLGEFDLLYGDTAQETTEWALEYQVLTRMLVHEKSLLVNPTFLDISEKDALQKILDCMPDEAKTVYQEARRLSDEEIQKLFTEEEGCA